MLKRLAWRFVRSAITAVIAGLVSKYQNDPRYLLVAPVLQTVGKYIREKYPNATVPF